MDRARIAHVQDNKTDEQTRDRIYPVNFGRGVWTVIGKWLAPERQKWQRTGRTNQVLCDNDGKNAR